MQNEHSTAILFVCLGNICRSPLAEGVFSHVAADLGLSSDFSVDSAGTGGWHVGSAPDPRSIAIAAKHGIDISGQSCRRIADDDFERFDLILGMDRSNVDDLKASGAHRYRSKVDLFCGKAGLGPIEIPDPYYGGDDGFANAYRVIREASVALAGQAR